MRRPVVLTQSECIDPDAAACTRSVHVAVSGCLEFQFDVMLFFVPPAACSHVSVV